MVVAAGAAQPTCTSAPTSAPGAPTPAPTPSWEKDYTSGAGLPYDASNDQLPAYAKAATSAAECVERCTTNRQTDTARGLPGCVAASWRSVAGSQQDWCVQWEAACEDDTPAAVSGYTAYAGTTITNPTKIAEPSTLDASATVWATTEEGWTTWMLDGEWGMAVHVVCIMMSVHGAGC